MFRRASVPLPLAGFGLELLHAESERSGLSVAEFMARAAVRYVADPDRERPSRRVPEFLKADGVRLGEQTIDVELVPELWTDLEQEAEAQGVSIELIVAHAAMLFAGDAG